MKNCAILAILLAACMSAGARMVADPIDSVMLPRLVFTNASLVDVAQTIEREFASHSKECHTSKLNIIVHPSCTNLLVSLELEPTSVKYALRVLRKMYDIMPTMIGGIIMLSRESSAPMEFRMYDVLPSVFQGSRVGGSDVTSFFSRFGISFPEGASAYHHPDVGKLIVRNRYAYLEDLEGVLSGLNVLNFQIEVSAKILRVDDLALATLAEHDPTPTNVNAVIAAAAPLARLTSIVSSGHTSTNSLAITASGGKTSGVSGGSCEFVFTPAVSPDGVFISLPFQASLDIPFAKDQRVVYAMNTSITLQNAASVLLWLSPPTPGGISDSTFCVLITVRTIDQTGHHVSTEWNIERIP